MRIVFISDTHNLHKKISIPKCDLLLHCGDFSSRGTKNELVNFLDWFAEQPAREKVFIAGNHDFICESNPDQVYSIVKNYNVNYLFESSVRLEGLNIFGSPWVTYLPNWAFSFKRNNPNEAISAWAKIPDNTDILLTHTPPYRIFDRVDRSMYVGEDLNVGCPHLLDRVNKVKPKIHAFGHIHEGYAGAEKGGINFINAASCTIKYNPTNSPVVFDL